MTVTSHQIDANTFIEQDSATPHYVTVITIDLEQQDRQLVLMSDDVTGYSTSIQDKMTELWSGVTDPGGASLLNDNTSADEFIPILDLLAEKSPIISPKFEGVPAYNIGVSSPLYTQDDKQLATTKTVKVAYDAAVADALTAAQAVDVTVESGTFTPVFAFSNPGDYSAVYTVQTGDYVRIGNVVTVHVNLVFTPTFTTATGGVRVTGMPFTASSPASISIGTTKNLRMLSTDRQFVCQVDANRVLLYFLRSEDAIVAVNQDDVTSGDETKLSMAGSYAFTNV